MATIKSIKYEKPPKTLYHYTSQTGLLGILKDKEIWASDIRYLSDASEYEYSVDLLEEVINKRKETLPPLPAVWKSLNYGFGFTDDIVYKQIEHYHINDFVNIAKQSEVLRIFVCSLSKEKDLLSQWRGYCPSGNGFSLGFDSKQLQIMADEQEFKLVKCIYNKNKQKKIIEQLLIEWAKELKKELPNLKNKQPPYLKEALLIELRVRFFSKFLDIAPSIKNESFEEENEWRLISHPTSIDDPKAEFRPDRSLIVPYIKFKLAEKNGKIPVNRIIIGPTPHGSLIYTSIMSILLKNDLGKCVVEKSKIPFRSW